MGARMTEYRYVMWINKALVDNLQHGGAPVWVRADGKPGEMPEWRSRLVPATDEITQTPAGRDK